MNTVDEQTLEKVKKLLRTGERGGTDAEREAALAAAQRMAARYNINLAEIDAKEITGAGEPIVDQEYTPERSGGGPVETHLPVAHKYIAWILGKYFAVEVLEGKKTVEAGFVPYRGTATSEWRKKYYRPCLNIIGRKTNVEIAIYVYGFLYHEFQRRWREYKRKTNAQLAERNSFYCGLYDGLCEKLTASQGEARLEAQHELATTKAEMSLVLVGEKEKVEAKMKELHPRIRYFTRDAGPIESYTALNDGRQQGKKININPAIK